MDTLQKKLIEEGEYSDWIFYADNLEIQEHIFEKQKQRPIFNSGLFNYT